jgi:hypothetical protein
MAAGRSERTPALLKSNNLCDLKVLCSRGVRTPNSEQPREKKKTCK